MVQRGSCRSKFQLYAKPPFTVHLHRPSQTPAALPSLACEYPRHSPNPQPCSRPLGHYSLPKPAERPTEEISRPRSASCLRTDTLGSNQWPPTGETTPVSSSLHLEKIHPVPNLHYRQLLSCSSADAHHLDYTGPSRASGSATHVLDVRLNLLATLVPGIFTAKTCLDIGCNAGNVSTQLGMWEGPPCSCSKRLYLQASHIDPCYSLRLSCSISHWRRHRSKASGPSRKTPGTTLFTCSSTNWRLITYRGLLPCLGSPHSWIPRRAEEQGSTQLITRVDTFGLALRTVCLRRLGCIGRPGNLRSIRRDPGPQCHQMDSSGASR